MKIEIWSDLICPFCYIGKRKFEQALEMFAHRSQVTVNYRSFELIPNGEMDPNQSIHEAMSRAIGVSVEQVKGMNENTTKIAAETGLTFRYDTMKPTNTLKSHRLVKYAAEQGKEHELVERLFQAYFTDSLWLDDDQVLLDLAGKCGLSDTAAQNVLTSDEYLDQVRADQQMAGELGIKGVPFFVINGTHGISGAQAPERIVDVLDQIWEENKQAE